MRNLNNQTAQLVGTSWDELDMVWGQLVSRWAWCLTSGAQNPTKPNEFAYVGGPYPRKWSNMMDCVVWMAVIVDTMVVVNLTWGLTGQSIP